MNTYWWTGDWRTNPLIQRSRDALLRQIACDLIRPYVERGDSMEHMLLSHCKWMMGGNHRWDAEKCGYRSSSVIGGYLIPGDAGVRCSTRQIGAMAEYPDGRVLWDVFDLPKLYEELKHGEKPRQLELWT